MSTEGDRGRGMLERQVSGCPSSIDSGRGTSVDADLHLYSYLDNHPGRKFQLYFQTQSIHKKFLANL